MINTRRTIFGALVAAGTLAAQKAARKLYFRRERPAKTPLFPSAVGYRDLVFISGHGVAEGTIQEQTKRVLDDIEQMLQKAGSSMHNVLKVTVYLNDIRNYAEMNEVYLGRFGPDPPARTCVEVSAIPLRGCLVEVDVIAHV